MKTKREKCLFPECAVESRYRGLCVSHYYSVLRHVKKGTVTWDELEKHGKSISGIRGRRNDDIAAWLTDFKNQED